jgi:hypothetical protein
LTARTVAWDREGRCRDCVADAGLTPLETDRQAYPRDETIAAGRRHRGQLVVEACVDAPATGQAQVHRCELADPQASKVVLDVLALSVDVRWRASLPAVIVAHFVTRSLGTHGMVAR